MAEVIIQLVVLAVGEHEGPGKGSDNRHFDATIAGQVILGVLA